MNLFSFLRALSRTLRNNPRRRPYFRSIRSWWK